MYTYTIYIPLCHLITERCIGNYTQFFDFKECYEYMAKLPMCVYICIYILYIYVCVCIHILYIYRYATFTERCIGNYTQFFDFKECYEYMAKLPMCVYIYVYIYYIYMCVCVNIYYIYTAMPPYYGALHRKLHSILRLQGVLRVHGQTANVRAYLAFGFRLNSLLGSEIPIHICVYTYIYIYVYIYIYICICICIYIYVYICMYIYVCVCVYIHICIYRYRYIYIYI